MKYRFQDNTLPFEERAKDLLSRLTREEKVGMITSQLDAIPRLGIQKTHIGTEIARGVVNRDQKRETTILPQPWGMAAMFDDALMEQRAFAQAFLRQQLRKRAPDDEREHHPALKARVLLKSV